MPKRNCMVASMHPREANRSSSDEGDPTPTVTRVLEADVPVDELWRAVVDDAERSEWMGDSAIEVVPGGRGHVTDEDGTVRTVRVHDVEVDGDHRRVALVWWDDAGEASEVELVVSPAPRGSRLRVVERRLGGGVARATLFAGRSLDLELRCLALARV